MKHVVILGAGFGGLELASRLSDSLAGEVRVTLIDQNDGVHVRLLEARHPVRRGRTQSRCRSPTASSRSRASSSGRSASPRSTPQPGTCTTDGGSYDADILVVALGAEYDVAATPGFAEGGFEYYSIAGAERMRDAALPAFTGGTILIGVLGQPYKCPPAPFEGAFLLHDQLVERGIREQTEIRVVAPMSAPVPVTPEVSQRFLDELAARDIEYIAQKRVVELDVPAKEAVLESGERLPYDLFVGIPIHRVPAVVAESGLAENGWVAVDPDTLMTPFPDVYAVGDCVAIPMAKAGVFAENAAGVAADDIIARLPRRDAGAALRGPGQLLPRVRQRARREGGGELPRRPVPDGDRRRPVARSSRPRRRVRLGPAQALVRRLAA